MSKNLYIPILLGFIILSCKSKQEELTKKPNLLIVLSDQHSYDMIGAYGNSQILTPNLDQLAAEGVCLTNAFSNQPVCTPFRGMLMSGMQPLKNGTFIGGDRDRSVPVRIDGLSSMSILT
tara:strand:- start:603 stop:962 length:360 start_codon:yes stop_codon:yes gene_type:complete